VQDQWPLLLLVLLGAVVVIGVQSWRLTRQREIARANQEATQREEARRIAAHVTFGLRADYLVAREGRRYVAVKTGRLAPRLSHAPTRRQLLEYGAAFDVQGVLLVDADAESVTHVEWDVFARNPGAGISARIVAVVAVLFFSAGLIAGTVINR
jgi:hypothetical protein